MYIFQRRARFEPPTETEEDRLPLGQSVLVIAGLAVLCWAVLIAIVMGLWAVL